MFPIESVVWGALGAGIVFVVGLCLTWFWIFPWSLRRFFRKAQEDGTKEQKTMINLVALFLETVINSIPYIIQKDEKGNFLIPDELKVIPEALMWLGAKQGTAMVNKAFGGIGKQIKNFGEGGLNVNALMNIADQVDMNDLVEAFGEKTAAKIGLGIKLAPLASMFMQNQQANNQIVGSSYNQTVDTVKPGVY